MHETALESIGVWQGWVEICVEAEAELGKVPGEWLADRLSSERST